MTLMINISDRWRIQGRGTNDGGLEVCTVIKPELSLKPILFGDALWLTRESVTKNGDKVCR